MNKIATKPSRITYAMPISISDLPRMPKRNAFTMYRIGFASDTFYQNSGNIDIE